MHSLRYYFDKAIDDKEKMSELEEIACEVMQNFKIAHPELYKDMLYKMHVAVFGEHFDEGTAECFIKEYGSHWNKDSTNVMAKRLGVTELCDFYVLVNYYYLKYYDLIGSNDNIYAKMAKKDIDDGNNTLLKEFLFK